MSFLFFAHLFVDQISKSSFRRRLATTMGRKLNCFFCQIAKSEKRKLFSPEMKLCTYIFLYKFLQMYIHIYLHVYTQMYTHLITCVFTHILTCILTCIYIYICIFLVSLCWYNFCLKVSVCGNGEDLFDAAVTVTLTQIKKVMPKRRQKVL